MTLKRSLYLAIKQLFQPKPGHIFFLVTVLLTAIVWGGFEWRQTVQVSSFVPPDKPVVSFLYPKWSDILTAGIPRLLAPAAQPVKPALRAGDMTLRHFVRAAAQYITHVDVADMRTALRNQIPLLAAFTPAGDKGSGLIKRPTLQFKPKTAPAVSKPLVGIYHTHTSESFVPNTGMTHRKGGQAGEIVSVGDALVKQLKRFDVQAVHSRQVHDYPSFMKAYGPSEITAKKMLAENPSLQILLDIHRDAEKRENSIVEYNGTTFSRMAIVVAIGQEDLIQPHWQDNLAFAKVIDEKMNTYFPGLSRGIQTVEWRYNQHLHPRALLFEVGSQETSLEEAERSVEVLGSILVEILAENNNFGVHE